MDRRLDAGLAISADSDINHPVDRAVRFSVLHRTKRLDSVG
jgi:hypothetical protein